MYNHTCMNKYTYISIQIYRYREYSYITWLPIWGQILVPITEVSIYLEHGVILIKLNFTWQLLPCNLSSIVPENTIQLPKEGKKVVVLTYSEIYEW